jgi:hypothetical protein
VTNPTCSTGQRTSMGKGMRTSTTS